MATPLRRLIETAFTSYLSGQVTGTTNIYEGMDTATKASPCIICQATGAEEEPYQSGNFRVSVEITVKAIAKDGVEQFDSLCDEVRTAIAIDDIHTHLQAAVTGLTVWGTSSEMKMDWDTEEDCWIEKTQIEVYAAAAALT